jgi:hypothetical protein
LYNATAGAQWKQSQNWLTGDPCADLWFGVMCDPDTSAVLSVYVLWHASHLGARAKTNKELLDNVYNSVLNRNNLVGTIPDGIDGLVNMLNMYVCCTHVSCSMCHLLVLMPLLSLTLSLSLSLWCVLPIAAT